MSILPKLIAMYRAEGFEPLTGYNPYHFGGWMDAPFTKFIKGNTLYGFAGLALQEVMMLEGLRDILQPKNILVIGNAHGWSTLALSLIFPNAKVVAVDPGEDGNGVTNEIAKKAGLTVRVVAGKSPQDVPRACAEHLDGKADLVLIDAVHTNEAMVVDYFACAPHANENAIWFFHDVINWKMTGAFQAIREKAGLKGRILTRTPSGMAVAWKTAPAEFEEYISVFGDNADVFRLYRKTMMDREVDVMTEALMRI